MTRPSPERKSMTLEPLFRESLMPASVGTLFTDGAERDTRRSSHLNNNTK